MGLDMYVWKVTPEVAGHRQINLDVSALVEKSWPRVWYWRKHPDLHGWMHKRYLDKGGDPEPEAFNGFAATVRLDAEDLAELRHDVETDALPHTEGFFFGTSLPEHKLSTLDFISVAEELVDQGWVLFYGSSW